MFIFHGSNNENDNHTDNDNNADKNGNILAGYANIFLFCMPVLLNRKEVLKALITSL